MTYRTVPSLLAGLVVAVTVVLGTGCGGGGDDASSPDALTPSDSGPLTDGGNPCQYQEGDDAGNATTAEATGLTISGDGTVMVCGQVDARAPVGGVIDRDRYRLAVDGGGDFVVRLHASAGRDVAVLELNLNDGTDLGRGYFIGSHAVFLSQLAPGEVTLEIIAGNLEAPPASIEYQVEIAQDERAQRCPILTGTATFTEVRDTTPNLNVGNDVVEVSFAGDTVEQTTAESDAPEATNLVVTDGMSYKLGGSLGINGNAAGYNDDYLDRDTFLIATGAQTTELAVRVSWPDDGIDGNGDDADLDFVLFRVPGSATLPPVELTAGAHGRDTPPELEATAVLPSSTYWLWIGNYQGSAQPKPYEITICGVDFSP